jgi:hypothetical protein
MELTITEQYESFVCSILTLIRSEKFFAENEQWAKLSMLFVHIREVLPERCIPIVICEKLFLHRTEVRFLFIAAEKCEPVWECKNANNKHWNTVNHWFGTERDGTINAVRSSLEVADSFDGVTGLVAVLTVQQVSVIEEEGGD